MTKFLTTFAHGGYFYSQTKFPARCDLELTSQAENLGASASIIWEHV
jgi:hypothetical protein